MKNFNLKSILATILLLLGISQTAWGRTIYLDTSGASQPYNSTSWWAHIWGGDGGGDKALTKVKDNLYEVEVGACSMIIFVPNNSVGNSWDNQTKDITIPSDKNCYQITSKDAGTWTTYASSGGGTIPTTYTVAGTSGTVFGTKDCANCTANDMVKQSDGTYILTIQNKHLTAYTRQCYFVGNHSASVWRYPEGTGYINYTNDTEGDYDITFILNPSVPSAEVILTPVGSSSTYTVTFNANGHGTTPTKQSVTSGGKATEPTAPTATGYTFGGWYTEAECTNKYDFNTEVTKNITLYAQWLKDYSADTYYYFDDKITKWDGSVGVLMTHAGDYAYVQRSAYNNTDNKFKIFPTNPKDDNNLTANSENIATGTLAGAIDLSDANDGWKNIKMPATTSDYFVILYYPNTTTNPSSKYLVAASYTLPDASKYTVFFNYNGGSGTTTSLSCDKGGSITLPTPNTREGYTFNGWYTTATGGTLAGAAGASYTPAGSLTLYAQWQKDDYSADTYYYFDDKITKWDGAVGEKMVNAAEYAFIQRPAYNNTDNKFKIFPTNPKGADNTKIANGENIAPDESPLKGDIKLTAEGGDYNNIKIEATTSDYFVILYYPGTTTNPSNQFLVAASYTLPNAESYNISFGVIGENGNLTAKSGNSTINVGDPVSFATFTATPTAGYTVEGWYSDDKGTQRITRAGTSTTYSQLITEANHSVYVKFVKLYAIYYKFNDQKWDNNYYAYIFTDEVWHSENGVQPKENRSECGQMTKYNDSVYYYKFTKSADYPRFAFSWGDHSNDNYFNDIDAVYRSDFHKDMPVFIAERGQSASVTKGKYYNKGVWMKFNDTDPGYELGVRNQSTGDMPYYRFAAENAGDYISTVDVVLTKGITYSFLVRNDKPYYFTPNSDTKWTSSNSHFELYNSNNSKEVVIEPDTTGIYTFQLNLANGKVEIDVLYPTTKYRLVYVEKDANNGTIKKFHPSHIIKSHPEATAKAPMFDTVSMHVRLKLLDKKAKPGTTNVLYDTVANTNDCEVWLQEYKEVGSTMEWKTIQNINTKDYLTTNGVYNFVITQANGNATIEPTAIRPYTGRYYIRTDASDGGWNDYKQLSNYCYYTEYSRAYRGFDYYYCHWAPKANLKYTIACDYSYCVSDTLAQEDHEPHKSFTNEDGTLQHEANVRFMWHSFSNELDRAYLAGADNNLYLLSNAGIYDMDGNKNTDAKLSDQQNWVYRVDVKADTRARIKLRAVPYNGANIYSWFRGLAGDFSDKNTEQLIEGKAGTRYTVRVIYDFKTDHLICAWIPDKDTITSDDVINADLMIIRTDQGEAAQLNFKPNQTKVTNITVAYCVLNLTKDHLESSTKTSKEKSCYWISFPYDVNLSDVFGCGKYGEDFIIQYYDGAERAQKGCWIDSPTYWKYITNPTGVVLKKGMGYVLVIDYVKILREQFKHSNASVNIYFPSSGPIDFINGEAPTEVEVPKHECTITRNDRYIYDSNWNIIGIPTWANIDQFGNPMVAVQSTSELSQGGTATYTIGFYYAHDAAKNKWTVCDTKEVDFLSMYSYLVQWAGTIDWQEKSVSSGEHHPTLAPRRYAPAAEGEEEAEGAEAPEQYTLRLTLNRGEQQLDHTYVRLQEGNVTTDFDLNYDMTKILNDGTNLYSLVGTNLIQCAANVQPLQEEAQTISIPLGVVADQDGLYTFSLPDGTEGMNVSIADFETGTVHNLALGDYQTALTAGTYEGRFALEIQPRQEVSTGCEQTDAAGKSLRKVLIDGNLYILRDGKAYTAAGQEL